MSKQLVRAYFKDKVPVTIAFACSDFFVIAFYSMTALEFQNMTFLGCATHFLLEITGEERKFLRESAFIFASRCFPC